MTFKISSPPRGRSGGVFLFAFFFILTVWFPLCAQQTTPTSLDPLHAWYTGSDPASLEMWVNQRLAAAQSDVDKVVAATGPRTVQNTLRPYDDAINELAIAGNESYVLFAVGDSAPLRDKAQPWRAKSLPPLRP